MEGAKAAVSGSIHSSFIVEAKTDTAEKDQQQRKFLISTLDPGAGVAELADAQDLGSCGRKAVGVQIPPSAP